MCAYQGLCVKVSISPTLDCCIVEGLCECLLNLGKPLVGSFDPSFFWPCMERLKTISYHLETTKFRRFAMSYFWDNPPSRNNRIGCCGEAASSEKLVSVVHSSQMQHTEHKAQRKNLCVKMLVCTSVCV